MRKVCAVVVTYNREKLLRECIGCLLNQIDEESDILIIDNASTDGTADMVTSMAGIDRIIYQNTGSNLGGAGGFHYGIKMAVEMGYEYVWIMDDDCMPTKTALHELLCADRELGGKYGFLSSKVLWKDNSICTMNVQRYPMYTPIKNFDQELLPASMASFVSLFVKSEVIRELGLPIREFFIWTDDWEFTRRISRKYSCYVASKSVVIHKSSSNIGANIATDTAERLERYWYLYRNDVYMYRREGIEGFLYECVRLASHIARVIFKAHDHRAARIGKIIRGTIAGFWFHPEIEYMAENSRIVESETLRGGTN